MKPRGNRCILLTTDEQPEQTRRILTRIARIYSGSAADDLERIRQRHHSVQRTLEPYPRSSCPMPGDWRRKSTTIAWKPGADSNAFGCLVWTQTSTSAREDGPSPVVARRVAFGVEPTVAAEMLANVGLDPNFFVEAHAQRRFKTKRPC